MQQLVDSRYFQRITKLIFSICCYLITQGCIAQQLCQPRLIIGSGALVHQHYAEARTLNDCDVTIDIRDQDHEQYIQPTHIMDMSMQDNLAKLVSIYPNHFEQINFEHVGDGLFSFVQDEEELQYFLSQLNSMLKTNGSLLYESFRGANSYSDDDGNDLDLGIADLVENHIQEIQKINSSIQLPFSTVDRFKQLVAENKKHLTNSGFQAITVKIKNHEASQRYFPNKYPYYYVEIAGIKK